MKEIIEVILLAYLINLFICGIINMFNLTRIPNSFKDFIKLTFLPYLLAHLKEVKYK